MIKRVQKVPRSYTMFVATSICSSDVPPASQGEPYYHITVTHATSQPGVDEVTVVDATDNRAKKSACIDAHLASNLEIFDEVMHPLLRLVTPSSSSGVCATAQAAVVLDGLPSSRSNVLFSPYDGILAASIREIARNPKTKDIYLSAVEVDEHNQLIDLLCEESKAKKLAGAARIDDAAQRTSSSSIIKASIVRSQIPTVVEDTNYSFTAIEETTFEDVTRDCHALLMYLSRNCVSDCRHQVFSLVITFHDSEANPNTTLQLISLAVHESTRGLRSARHCISNAASLIESRSTGISFTSSKILFLLKPCLLGKQPGAWLSLYHPTNTARAQSSEPNSVETFKEAFIMTQTLNRIYSIRGNSSVSCWLKAPRHVVSGIAASQTEFYTKVTAATTPIKALSGEDIVNNTSAVGQSTPGARSTVSTDTVRRVIRLTDDVDKRFNKLLSSDRARIHPVLASNTDDSVTKASGDDDDDDDDPRPRSQFPTKISMNPNKQLQQNTKRTAGKDDAWRGEVEKPMRSHSHTTRRKIPKSSTDSQEEEQQLERLLASAERKRRTESMKQRLRELQHGAVEGPSLLAEEKTVSSRSTHSIRNGPLDDESENNNVSSRHIAHMKQQLQSRQRTASSLSSVNSKRTARPQGSMAVVAPSRDGAPTSSADDGRQPTVQSISPSHQCPRCATVLHNYETYKHAMEGALARLRKDIVTSTAQLDDTKKLLRAKEKSLRNGSEGQTNSVKELEKATKRVHALESDYQRLQGEHHHSKGLWKSQRAQLTLENDNLQRQVNDLLETINGLESALTRSQEAVLSRTKGLTSVATTMTTIQGITSLPHDQAMQKLVGVGKAATAHVVSTVANPTVLVSGGGIPRGTQTSFPNAVDLYSQVQENDIKVKEYNELVQSLQREVRAFEEREHSLQQRILELENEVTFMGEREIASKTVVLKLEQAMRLEKQDAERRRREKEVSVLSTAAQATASPDMQDIVIHELEAANRELSAQLRTLDRDLSGAKRLLALEKDTAERTQDELTTRIEALEAELHKERKGREAQVKSLSEDCDRSMRSLEDKGRECGRLAKAIEELTRQLDALREENEALKHTVQQYVEEKAADGREISCSPHSLQEHDDDANFFSSPSPMTAFGKGRRSTSPAMDVPTQRPYPHPVGRGSVSPPSLTSQRRVPPQVAHSQTVAGGKGAGAKHSPATGPAAPSMIIPPPAIVSNLKSSPRVAVTSPQRAATPLLPHREGWRVAPNSPDGVLMASPESPSATVARRGGSTKETPPRRQAVPHDTFLSPQASMMPGARRPMSSGSGGGGMLAGVAASVSRGAGGGGILKH